MGRERTRSGLRPCVADLQVNALVSQMNIVGKAKLHTQDVVKDLLHHRQTALERMYFDRLVFLELFERVVGL